MNGTYGGLHAEENRAQSNRDSAGFEASRDQMATRTCAAARQ